MTRTFCALKAPQKEKGKTTVAYRLAQYDRYEKRDSRKICSPVIGATGLHRGFNSTITWLPFMKNMTAKPKDIS